jgi:hypothetical protein
VMLKELFKFAQTVFVSFMCGYFSKRHWTAGLHNDTQFGSCAKGKRGFRYSFRRNLHFKGAANTFTSQFELRSV